MAIDYAALKTELQTDPTGLGYAGPIGRGETQVVANILNLARPSIQINRDVIPAYEIVDGIAPADFTSLSAGERQRLGLITGAGQVNIRNQNIRDQLLTSFGPGTQTRTNLASIQTRDGSRAEQLFGEGVALQSIDITIALQS